MPGDPYSPPCIAFSGSNGGATSPGVSANAINVTYRITSDSESFQQTLASLGGADITDTTADIERTISALATYFNTHFQFYGRKLNIEYFNGQGSITNELLGSGQQQADADAVTAAQQLHSFAELDGVTEPYDVALAGQKVISIGAPYLSASFMGQYAPYMWSLDTESNDVVTATQDLYLKSMAGHPAAYAGGSLQNQPRKVAIIAPSDPWYQSAAAAAVAGGGGGGLPGGGQHPVPAEPVHALEPGGHDHQPAAERRHHHGHLRLRPGDPGLPHLARRRAGVHARVGGGRRRPDRRRTSSASSSTNRSGTTLSASPSRARRCPRRTPSATRPTSRSARAPSRPTPST